MICFQVNQNQPYSVRLELIGSSFYEGYLFKKIYLFLAHLTLESDIGIQKPMFDLDLFDVNLLIT